MPLRPLPYREVKRKLEAAGFKEVSSKGSHVKFAKVTQLGTYTAVVPHHREVPSAPFAAFSSRPESAPTSLRDCKPPQT